MLPTRTVERWLTYEYLPPTKQNQKLLDVRAQHPRAATRPAATMPKPFAQVVHPPTCGQPAP